MWKNIVEREVHRWQPGACELHAGYLRLKTHTQNVYLLLSHDNNGHVKTTLFYVYTYISCPVMTWELFSFKAFLWTNPSVLLYDGSRTVPFYWCPVFWSTTMFLFIRGFQIFCVTHCNILMVSVAHWEYQSGILPFRDVKTWLSHGHSFSTSEHSSFINTLMANVYICLLVFTLRESEANLFALMRLTCLFSPPGESGGQKNVKLWS